ncbi:MAG: hypothetical protein ABI547_03950 [Betaproteobacteria bacterium]
METLAAWVPTAPEMEVKLLLGEHIWDVAQHADALGKRTFELRMPLQHSLRPIDAYAQMLAEVAKITPSPQRLAAIYDVILPGVSSRYRCYLNETDSLADAPTVRILERHLADIERMVGACRELWRELPALKFDDPAWVDAMRKREAADSVVAPAATADTVGA